MNIKRTILMIVVLAICLVGCSTKEKQKEIPPNENPSNGGDVVDKPDESSELIDKELKLTICTNSGPETAKYRFNYRLYFGDMLGNWLSLIPDEQIRPWLAQFKGKSEDGIRDYNELNLKTIVDQFKIPRSKIEEWRALDILSANLTDKELDVLYGNDQEKINQTFVNPETIYHNGKFYTPKWFAEHTIEAYQKENIPKEKLKNKLTIWKEELTFVGCYMDGYKKFYEKPTYSYVEQKVLKYINS